MKIKKNKIKIKHTPQNKKRYKKKPQENQT
jgi:hypothetical protein